MKCKITSSLKTRHFSRSGVHRQAGFLFSTASWWILRSKWNVLILEFYGICNTSIYRMWNIPEKNSVASGYCHLENTWSLWIYTLHISNERILYTKYIWMRPWDNYQSRFRVSVNLFLRVHTGYFRVLYDLSCEVSVEGHCWTGTHGVILERQLEKYP